MSKGDYLFFVDAVNNHMLSDVPRFLIKEEERDGEDVWEEWFNSKGGCIHLSSQA